MATEIHHVNEVKANFLVSLPAITINEDGRIYPQTDLIAKTSQNMYTLTGDISQYVLVVMCSNIVLDGAGYCINGTAMQGVGYNNVGLTLEGVSNVTVKNLEVCNFGDYCIKLENCSECLIYNVTADDLSLGNSILIKVIENRISDALSLGQKNQVNRSNIGTLLLVQHNLVTENNISSITIASNTANNTVFKNNFFCLMNSFKESGTNFWNNGTVGNYWKDYNGTDEDKNGIGDAAYCVYVIALG
ncbi:MAG: hypothetical protein ACFCUE_12975 [Candidatus Bathyarchaeia archaeon]